MNLVAMENHIDHCGGCSCHKPPKCLYWALVLCPFPRRRGPMLGAGVAVVNPAIRCHPGGFSAWTVHVDLPSPVPLSKAPGAVDQELVPWSLHCGCPMLLVLRSDESTFCCVLLMQRQICHHHLLHLTNQMLQPEQHVVHTTDIVVVHTTDISAHSSRVCVVGGWFNLCALIVLVQHRCAGSPCSPRA